MTKEKRKELEENLINLIVIYYPELQGKTNAETLQNFWKTRDFIEGYSIIFSAMTTAYNSAIDDVVLQTNERSIIQLKL